jgi:hypothetical protein
MLDIKNMDFIDKSEIKNRANSIFTTTGSPSTSDKYAHISTEKIIDDMELLGWGVVDAKQVKARKSVGFQKHLVVFRNPEIVIDGADGDTVFPQILLTNSHDGKNAFTFTAGLFRMICENGLVVCNQEFENLKIRHYGYDFEELEKTINAMVEKLPLTVESMNRFKTTVLNSNQMLDFAKRALNSRFTDNELEHITIDLNDLLTPSREEDKGNDMWSVFNTVQEKLTHGLFNYGYGSKNRKARKIKNFNKDMELNNKLYQLANEFVN